MSAADALLTLFLCLGIISVAAPVARDFIATSRARRMISSMTSTSDKTHDEQRCNQLTRAQCYNQAMGGVEAKSDNEGMGGGNDTRADILELATDSQEIDAACYEEQLRQEGTQAMCWVEIPSISVSQPVSHGTSDEVLASGAGHLEWTSLPVGGCPSHCVICAHSGMQDSRMFDDLESMRIGDEFYLHTLGDTYAYLVYDMEVLLPQEAELHCAIVPNEDLCTLMTCTPYGINTHRLLVHGRRIPYVPTTREQSSNQPRIHIGRRIRPVVATAAGLISIALLAGIVRAIRCAALSPKDVSHHV
ncbi:MAG: class C sortase [Atopobiaceae bacterium]|nr:class C sortase [Atopobiaceae bacterium]